MILIFLSLAEHGNSVRCVPLDKWRIIASGPAGCTLVFGKSLPRRELGLSARVIELSKRSSGAQFFQNGRRIGEYRRDMLNQGSGTHDGSQIGFA